MNGNDNERTHWSELLTDEQRKQLQWLNTHRCQVEVARAEPDPLHDLKGGYVMEILVDKHAVVKIRSEEVSQAFEYAFKAAKQLFDFVEEYDPMWRGVAPTEKDKPELTRRTKDKDDLK